MSQIGQIKSRIEQVADNISKTAIAMNAYSQSLKEQISEVDASIGGTASGEDKEMKLALQSAQQAVQNAALQLQDAARKAKEWVNHA